MVELEYEGSDKNIEEETMQLLHDIEDNIWNFSLLKNPRLKAKICQVAHTHTIEVLTLSHER